MATQSDVDAIINAMSSNVLQVHFADGRRVIYRSIPEMRDALDIVRAEVARGANGFDNRDRGTFITVDRR